MLLDYQHHIMGTDIHGVFQRHDTTTNAWVDIEHQYEMNRHYQLFAVLAGVRNGTGFAGVKTGEAVKPISEPRGYPEGFDGGEDDIYPVSDARVLAPWRREHLEEGEPLEIWMGDHSHSWLAGAEMLEWFTSAPGVVQTGIISRDEYETWDGTSAPESYCGGISGSCVIVINDNEVERENTDGWSHIRVEWNTSLRDELAYFFDEVKRLADEHGTIRFVFGFDS